MENNLEYIDAYFNKMLSPEEAILFEKKIEEEKDFAEDVAFYLSAKQSAQEEVNLEKKERFRQLLMQAGDLAKVRPQGVVRRMGYRIAAAAAILICVSVAGYFVFFKPGSPPQMADKYINENLVTLGVKMGTVLDSIEDGKRLYNDARYDSAIHQFESIVQRDTANFTAKEYLGIAYLRVGNYDKALLYFQQLGNYSLQSNPGTFYEALTLMKRNQPGDKQTAKQLLKQVVDDDLEGKETARQWLRKL